MRVGLIRVDNDTSYPALKAAIAPPKAGVRVAKTMILTVLEAPKAPGSSLVDTF
jgi:hypothetical protein